MNRPVSGHSSVAAGRLPAWSARTEGIVKILRVLAVICFLAVLPLGAASAQQGTRTFQDPRGWFSVSLPADWTPAGERSLGASFIQGFQSGDTAGLLRSSLA